MVSGSWPMGVGQQSTPNLLVCSRHFELIEARPETQFPATTMHCLATHFHPSVNSPNLVRLLQSTRRDAEKTCAERPERPEGDGAVGTIAGTATHRNGDRRAAFRPQRSGN